MFIITGASDGLGLELARLLLAQGKAVTSLSRRKPSVAEIDWLETDLSQERSIESAAGRLLGRGESFEALVNCAGVMTIAPETLMFDELDRVFRANILGHIMLTAKLMPRIKKDGADIVNVSSDVAVKGYFDQAYGASKWAMRGFSQNLQLELKDTPCRVISFCPGGFRSRILEKVTGQKLRDPENWMAAEDVARCLLQTIELPKNMQVSEIIVNRKVVTL